MIGRRAKLPERLIMLLRWIAFVVSPSILRILLMQAQHIVVAIRLSEHRSRSNRHIRRIAMHNGVGLNSHQLTFRHIWAPLIAIHEYMLRTNAEFI